jgi:hypothetical protein
VLGGTGRRIDRASVLIGARDDVLFHQVHVRLLLCLKNFSSLERRADGLSFFLLSRAGKKRKEATLGDEDQR